ncbi:MAG: efflux RND transporter periplasmic adaptor subunit [Pseudolabrys sp.]|jgi:multidrug efflux system membrane fusion protein
MHGELPKLKKTKKSRAGRLLAGTLMLAGVAAALYYVFGTPLPQQKHFRRYAAAGPVPVLAQAAARADVPVYIDAVGTAKPLNMVTVRPQVDGKLISVNFKEGQDVKKGDVLARIDPTIYKAALDQALAKKAQDEAQLANAKNDLARYEKLARSNAINKQQADTQKALVAQYAAQIQADQGAIENARATLGYTDITAPISGRTGLRMVDEGNIVRASDSSSAIVTVTQLKPIAVIFNLPQQDLDRVNTAFEKGPLAVDALRPADNSVIEHGTLKVIDNQVDPTTGTVKLKAEFANGKLRLWPGQFVNIRLKVDTLKDVVVIPTAAVQRGPDGTFVYVVKPDNTAAMRKIAVQRQNEKQTVVKSGVTPPERVITTGFSRLTDGAHVTLGRGRRPQAPQGGHPQGEHSQGKPQAAHPQGDRAGGAQAHERRRGGGRKPPGQ